MWFLQSGITFQHLVARLSAIIVIVFFSLPFHEYIQGLAADKLGDDTAKLSGRLTLDPSVHFSGFGAIWLLLFDYGWAQRIPINHYNLKNPKRDMALIGIAGPVSYIISAMLGGILLNFVPLLINKNSVHAIGLFIYYYISINISLASFNLIPIYPLDGFKIIQAFLPENILEKFYSNFYRITWMLIILMAFGFFSPFMSFVERFLYGLIMRTTCFV